MEPSLNHEANLSANLLTVGTNTNDDTQAIGFSLAELEKKRDLPVQSGTRKRNPFHTVSYLYDNLQIYKRVHVGVCNRVHYRKAVNWWRTAFK